MPTATCPMPDHESSQVRSAWSARSYEGDEHLAKPSDASYASFWPDDRCPGRTWYDAILICLPGSLVPLRLGACRIVSAASRAQLQPLPPAERRCGRAAARFASPGFAPPPAPPVPCVVLPLEASRSRRGAPGCCRSGPCDSMGTRVNGRRTDQVRQPLAGGTSLCNERTPGSLHQAQRARQE